MSFTDDFLKELEKKKKKIDNSIVVSPYASKAGKENDKAKQNARSSTGDSFTDEFLNELGSLAKKNGTTYEISTYDEDDDIGPTFDYDEGRSGGGGRGGKFGDPSKMSEKEKRINHLKVEIGEIEDLLGYNDSFGERLLNFGGEDGWLTQLIQGIATGQNTDQQLKDLLKEYKAELASLENPEEAQDEKKDKWYEGWLKGGAFSDGYQVGDLAGTAIATVGDTALGVVQGFGNMYEGITDFILQGGSEAADWVGLDSVSDYLEKGANKQTINTLVNSIKGDYIRDNTIWGEKGQSIPQGVGNILGMIYGGKALGGAGLGTKGVSIGTSVGMGASSAGSAIGEAKSEGIATHEYATQMVQELDIAYDDGRLTKEEYDAAIAELDEQLNGRLDEALDGSTVTDIEAWSYGTAKGTIDALTELMFGGLGKGVEAVGISRGIGGFDDIFAKKASEKLTKHITNKYAKRIVANGTEYVIKASGEGLEEVVATYGDAFAKKLTYMSDEELSELINHEEALEAFISSFVASGITQGGDLVSSVKGDTDFVTGYTDNEQAVIDKEIEKRITEQEKDGKKLTNNEKKKITEAVKEDLDKGYISIDTIEEVLGGDSYKSYRETVESEDALKSEFEELEKVKTNDATLGQSSRYNELKNKLAELETTSQRSILERKYKDDAYEVAKGSRLESSYFERARGGEAFTADLSKYDEKQRATIQSAIDAGFLNNRGRTHDFVNLIAKISADKGVTFDFLNNEKLKTSGFAVDGAIVNGYYDKKSGTVGINLNTDKALNTVVGHEITHVLEGTEIYNELQTALINYAKAKGDYQGRVDALSKLYDAKDIDSELTADLVGDYLFTDADFVNRLSTEHRNVFQKVFDEIKYLYKTATAGSKEARELEKVKRVFEEAYRTNVKGQTEAQSDVKHSLSKITSEEDAEYLSEIEQGNTVYAGWLVDKAARQAGYKKRMFHETDAENIHVFDISRGTHGGTDSETPYGIFTKSTDKNIGLGNRQMALYVKADKTLYVKDRADVKNKIPSLVPYYDEIARIDQEYDKLCSKWEDAEFEALEEWVEANPDADMDVVYPTSHIIEKKPANIDSPKYLEAFEKHEQASKEWGERYDEIAIKCKEIITSYLRSNDYDSMYLEIDGGSRGRQTDSLIVLDANQVKSADPVTYDNKGNVIPLSERFNENSNDIRYSLSKDSDGNALSDGQKEFFKDSKAVDRDGNLLKVYHTTNSDFMVFDDSKIGSTTGAYNSYLGHFFTNDPEYMSEFPEFEGGKTEAYYLNMKNPIDMNNISREAFLDIVEVTGGDVTEAAEVFDRMYAEEVERAKFRNGTPALELSGLLEELTGEYFFDTEFHDALRPNYDKLIAKGYDGVINNMDGAGWANEYVVLNSNQAKLVTNTNPTSDPDVRYSFSEQETAKKLNDVGLQYDVQSETVSYSLSSLEEAFDYNKGDAEYLAARDEYVNALARSIAEDKNNPTQEEINKANRYLDGLFLVHDMIAQDKERLDYEAAVDKSAWVSNAEYGGSIDFSTLCAKRRLFTGTFDAIQNALPDTVLNENDFLQIRNMLLEKELESPCSMCYVEGSRAKHGEYVDKFLKEYLKTNPEWKPQIADFTSTTRLEQTRINHPEAYKAYQDAMNKLAQRKPKEASVRTDYKGEILVAFADGSSVEIKNKNGGIRFNSFSDFEIIHAIDCMQVLTDMARVGLNGQAYTKVKEFAESFGNTGLKINLSLVAKDVDANGKLIMDETNGMKYAEAMDIRNRYSENVGTVIVVFNDAQLKAALADNTIDYVLPFHRSQWKKSQYAMMGLPTQTRDYTMVQNDRTTNPNTGKPVKLSKLKKTTTYTNDITGETFEIKDNIMPNQYWDFSKGGRENAQRYLDYINANGMTPKFDSVLEKVDGRWVLPEGAIGDGYYKLLIDFKMYDNDGWGSPQKPVVPEFNMPYIQKMLENYKGGHKAFPVAHDVVDAFVEGKRNGTFSLSAEGEPSREYGSYNVYGRDMTLGEDIAPIQEDVAPVASTQAAPEAMTDRAEVLPDDYAPMTEDEAAMVENEALSSLTDEDAPPVPEEETALVQEKSILFEDYESKKADIQKLIDDKNGFISKRANELYWELSGLKKGVRASRELGYLLDQGYSWGELKTALVNTKLHPDSRVREDSAIESIVREALNEEYENLAYEIDEIDSEYNEKVQKLEADAKAKNKVLSVREVYEQKLANHKNSLAALEAGKERSLANFNEAIGKKLNEYNSLKNKNTKRANTLLQQMENLRLRRDNVQADYANRIAKQQARLEAFESKSYEEFEQKELAVRRRDNHKRIVDGIKARFTEQGYDLDEVFDKAKNLSTFATVDNTPQRVMEKSLGYKEGQILSDLTVDQVARNESEGIKWLNSVTNKKDGLLAQLVKKYGIKPGSKASAAAQMYAEGFFVDTNGDVIKYGDAELAKDFPNEQVRQNIIGLARDQRVRQFYDETLDKINESRVRNAYPEIQKLDNYFLHFRAMEDTFSRLGLPFNPNDIKAKDLPTDLNGVTADLKPGQPYFASARHREGIRTSHDLLGGLERYASSAKNQIYHIDDIQTLRAIRNYIADGYGQAKGLESLDSLTEEEAQEKIKQVYGSHLSTFAKFLNEEANVIAGKTALIDRGLEGIIGRRGITLIDTINKQVGANMVGFNVSSSLTNFIPVAQTFAKSNKYDFTKAFAQTASNKINSIFGRSDEFIDNNPTVLRRRGADRFYQTPYQKVGDIGYTLMGVVDDISTELIVRTKYNEYTRKGMSEQDAINAADKWTSRLMADRSLGQMPQIYNSRMLGLFTKFQLEVRNQLDAQFYDTIQETKVSNEEIENGLLRNAKTAAQVTSTFAQLAIAQHLYGMAFEAIAGYNPAFDIVSVLATALGFDDDEDDEDTVLDNLGQGFLELLEDLPYTSALTGGGRIPISSALPIEDVLTAISGQDANGNEISRKDAWKTVGEAAPYYFMPGGYGQLKKTIKGMEMFDEDLPIAGSYTDSGKLRYPVDDTVKNRLQAAIFGQYANENAGKYFDGGHKALDEKQIQEFIDVDIPIEDYWDYREGLYALNKKSETGTASLAEKIDYIMSLDLPIEKKNLLANNLTERKEPIDLTGYEEYGNYKDFDFAKKYPEKYAFLQDHNISVSEYEEFDEDTKGAYTWASKNPAKYKVSKAISDDLMTYRSYTDALYDIKADKDEDGKSISGSRKEKVINYINNLDADYGQKIILFKSEYPTDDTYNYEIIDYLNGRDDISYSDMVTILTELGFKVEGDNVYWD